MSDKQLQIIEDFLDLTIRQEKHITELQAAGTRLLLRARNAEYVLKSFVSEIRAYQSPECEEDPIIGPLLKEADKVLKGVT